MKLLVVSIIDVNKDELKDIANGISERGDYEIKPKELYEGLINGKEYEYFDEDQLTRYSLYDEKKLL